MSRKIGSKGLHSTFGTINAEKNDCQQAEKTLDDRDHGAENPRETQQPSGKAAEMHPVAFGRRGSERAAGFVRPVASTGQRLLSALVAGLAIRLAHLV